MPAGAWPSSRGRGGRRGRGARASRAPARSSSRSRPFMTRAMIDGMDRLLAHALVARHRGAARGAARAGCCPTSATGSRGGAGAHRRARCSAATARWRRCATPPSRPAARSTSCSRRRRRCRPSPPSWRARPTTRARRSSTSPSRCLQHERAAGRVRQLRLHRATACRSACRSRGPGTTTSACCSWRAPGECCGRRSGPGRWPAPGPDSVRQDDARQSDRHGVATRRWPRRERALWRMMSFYGAPLADLDAAIAADPAGSCRA